jgi:hypothetical protein
VLEAGDFLKALGYPTEAEALRIVSDGSVLNVPHSTVDVKRFFDIYGAQVPSLRGKATRRHVKVHRVENPTSKMQITDQQVVADMIHVAGEKFLLSISSPLELLLVYHLASLKTEDLRNALQKHVNTLRSWGFKPKVVYIDPQSRLTSLQGKFPGTEIDVSRAGDHLDKLDIRTRRLKELMHSIVSGLPFCFKKEHVKDLVTYAVSRTNLKSASSLNMNVCLRVRFTGFKPDYKSEFGLAFGVYVEAFNPTSAQRSNDIHLERTQPCIALNPCGNRNGSWVMLNMRTKAYVRKSQWRRLPVTKFVIDVMNEDAGDHQVSIADEEIGQLPTEPELVDQVAMQEPMYVPQLPATEEEAMIVDDDGADTGVPELG